MATLKAQLTTRLAWARRHPDKRTRLDLANGLGITLYVDGLGDTHVLLTRPGRIGPSAQEAKTVLAHWPEPAAGAEWTPGTSGAVTWLAATLSKPRQLTLADAGAAQKGAR